MHYQPAQLTPLAQRLNPARLERNFLKRNGLCSSRRTREFFTVVAASAEVYGIGSSVDLGEQPRRVVGQAPFGQPPAQQFGSGGELGCSSWNQNRRRMAASTSAMERSAVFIVARMTMVPGSLKPVAHCAP